MAKKRKDTRSNAGDDTLPAFVAEEVTVRDLEDFQLLRQIFLGGIRLRPVRWPLRNERIELLASGKGWRMAEDGALEWAADVCSVGPSVFPLTLENLTQDTLSVWAEGSEVLTARWPDGATEMRLPPACRPVPLHLCYTGREVARGNLSAGVTLVAVREGGASRRMDIAFRFTLAADVPFLEVSGLPGELPSLADFGLFDPVHDAPPLRREEWKNRGERPLSVEFPPLPEWLTLEGPGLRSGPGGERVLNLAPDEASELAFGVRPGQVAAAGEPAVPLGFFRATVPLRTNDVRATGGVAPLTFVCRCAVAGPCVQAWIRTPVPVGEDGTADADLLLLNLGDRAARLEVGANAAVWCRCQSVEVPPADDTGQPGAARWELSWPMAADGGEQRRVVPLRLATAEGEGLPSAAGSAEVRRLFREAGPQAVALPGYWTAGEGAPLVFSWNWEDICFRGVERMAVSVGPDGAPLPVPVDGPMLGGRLEWGSDVLDFPAVLHREKPRRRVEVRNTGGRPTTLRGIRSSAPWVRVRGAKLPLALVPMGTGDATWHENIAASGSAVFEVLGDPSGLPPGRHEAAIALETDPPGPVPLLAVRMETMPPAEAYPGYLAVNLDADGPGGVAAVLWDGAGEDVLPVPAADAGFPSVLEILDESGDCEIAAGETEDAAASGERCTVRLADLFPHLGSPLEVEALGRAYSMEELLGLYLDRVTARAERALYERGGRKKALAVDRCVAVVPADFQEGQVQACREAVRLAGLVPRSANAKPGREDPKPVLRRPEADAVFLYHAIAKDERQRRNLQALFEALRPADILVCRLGRRDFAAYTVRIKLEAGLACLEPRHPVIGRGLGWEGLEADGTGDRAGVLRQALQRVSLLPSDVDFVYWDTAEPRWIPEIVGRFPELARELPMDRVMVGGGVSPGGDSATGAAYYAVNAGRPRKGYVLSSLCRDPWVLFGDTWELAGIDPAEPWLEGFPAAVFVIVRNNTARPLLVRLRRKGSCVVLMAPSEVAVSPGGTERLKVQLHFSPAECAPGTFTTFVEMESDLPAQPVLTVPLKGEIVRPAGKACPQCGRVAALPAGVCDLCGALLEKARPLPAGEVLSCVSCGLTFAPPARFCPRDGGALAPPRQKP